jgi:RNA polymerase sigma-70 factor (ECF subfamily)
LVLKVDQALLQNLDIHHQLIDQCREGNPKAQFQLYNLYSKQMLNISHRIVNDRMEAEDVLQESFINAFSRLKSFRGESSFGSWLKRIVINQSLNVVRRKKQFFEEINDDTFGLQDEEEKDEEANDYNVKDIHTALQQLPDGYRVIFSLYMFEDLSHNEIAEQLNISVNTSKSQLSRARKKMKELMQKNKEDEKGSI